LPSLHFSYPIIKRRADLLLSLILLVLLSPIILFTALVVYLAMGHPVIFSQVRPGKSEKLFLLYKFRTMTLPRDTNCHSHDDAYRLTKVGRLLRTTSLDELPSLLNVLRGDISFVGPRPLLVQYLGLYSPEEKRRHDVMPGLSGWAQVNGRNAISWKEKFRLDIWYVDHQSFWLDVRILFLTIWKVIKRDGISAPGEATVQYFKGSQSHD
jgi:sugar transferase EpsL